MGSLRVKGDRTVSWDNTQAVAVGPAGSWTRPSYSDSDTIHVSALSGSSGGAGTAADPVDTITGGLALCVSGGKTKLAILDSETYTERVDNASLSSITIICASGCNPEIVQPAASLSALSASGYAGNDFLCIEKDENGRLWVGDEGLTYNVYYSDDGGETWTGTLCGTGGSVSAICYSSGVLYASNQNGSTYGLYRWTGSAWSLVKTSTYQITGLQDFDGILLVRMIGATGASDSGLYWYNTAAVVFSEVAALGDSNKYFLGFNGKYVYGDFAFSADDDPVRGIYQVYLQTDGSLIMSLALRWDYTGGSSTTGVSIAGGYVWVWNDTTIKRAIIDGTRWEILDAPSGLNNIVEALGTVYGITDTAVYKWTGYAWEALSGSMTYNSISAAITGRLVMFGYYAGSNHYNAVQLAHFGLPSVIYGGQLAGWGLIAAGVDMEYRYCTPSGYARSQDGGEALLSGAVFDDTGPVYADDSLTLENSVGHNVTGGFRLDGSGALQLNIDHASVVGGDLGLVVVGTGTITGSVDNSIFDCGIDIQTVQPVKVLSSRVRVIDGEFSDDSADVVSDLPHFVDRENGDLSLRSLAGGFRYDSPLLSLGTDGKDLGAYQYTRTVTGVTFGVDYTVYDDPGTVKESSKLPGVGGSEGADGSFFAWTGAEREARALTWEWGENSVSTVAQVAELRAIWKSCISYLIGLSDGEGGWQYTPVLLNLTAAGSAYADGETVLTVTTSETFDADAYAGELLLHDSGAYRIKEHTSSAAGTITFTVLDPGGVFKGSIGTTDSADIMTGYRAPRLMRFDPRQSFDFASPNSGAWPLSDEEYRGGYTLIGREVQVDD